MYNKENINKLKWEDIEKMVEDMREKILEYEKQEGITFNIICPILRGGSIPAMLLAYGLKIINICPQQYKYINENKKQRMKELLGINEEFAERYSDRKVNIIVVEGNSSTGNTANICISEIRRRFNVNKLAYCALKQDYYYKDVVDADLKLVGIYTNENERLSEEQCKKANVDYMKYNIFPWEKAEEELAELNIEDYDYRGM